MRCCRKRRTGADIVLMQASKARYEQSEDLQKAQRKLQELETQQKEAQDSALALGSDSRAALHLCLLAHATQNAEPYVFNTQASNAWEESSEKLQQVQRQLQEAEAERNDTQAGAAAALSEKEATAQKCAELEQMHGKMKVSLHLKIHERQLNRQHLFFANQVIFQPLAWHLHEVGIGQPANSWTRTANDDLLGAMRCVPIQQPRALQPLLPLSCYPAVITWPSAW